jgi:ATP-dependent protease HslVU (ClpYQ) peptidase subunit
MTLIVAVRDGQCAVLACDSLVVYGESTTTPEKCFKAWEVTVSVQHAQTDATTERLLVGCAGDVRAIMHLRHACVWPPRPADQDVHAWLVLSAVPAMRRAIREISDETSKPEAHEAADATDDFVDAVVCAPHGRLFHVFPNQCVTEHADFVAAGSAAREATAAYEALRLTQAAQVEQSGARPLVSWEIADLVMAAAARIHAEVRGPFHMLSI